MNGLSLFAGIGGLDLGLERAGVHVVGQVEIDPFCRRVLAKHWPDIPRHDDVRTAADWWQTQERPHVDVVFGGFPCQDISNAGLRAGIDGERSGLWGAFADTIRVVRPRYVLLENVAALLARGAGRVLGDLAELGYDAEWGCVSAADVGANHLRRRFFALAYPSAQAGRRLGAGRRQQLPEGGQAARDAADAVGGVVRLEPVTQPRRRGASVVGTDGPAVPVADSNGDGRDLRTRPCGVGGKLAEPAHSSHDLAHPESLGGELRPAQERRLRRPAGRSVDVAHADSPGPQGGRVGRPWPTPVRDSWWDVEPDVGRVAHGVPGRVDRLRGLGNAVVPQVAEHVGRLLMALDGAA